MLSDTNTPEFSPSSLTVCRTWKINIPRQKRISKKGDAQGQGPRIQGWNDIDQGEAVGLPMDVVNWAETEFCQVKRSWPSQEPYVVL